MRAIKLEYKNSDLSGSQENWFNKINNDLKDYEIMLYMEQFKLDRNNAKAYLEWSWNNQKKIVINPIINLNKIKICDIGCGSGSIHKYFFDKNYDNQLIGIDIAKSGLKIASTLNKKYNCKYILSDATNLPFKKHSIDHVISLQLWQNFHNPKSFITEMVRITKNNGSIIISTTNYFHELMFSPTTLISFLLNGEQPINSKRKIQSIFYDLNIPVEISYITFRPKQSFLKYIPNRLFKFVLYHCKYLEQYFNLFKLNRFLAITVIDIGYVNRKPRKKISFFKFIYMFPISLIVLSILIISHWILDIYNWIIIKVDK